MHIIIQLLLLFALLSGALQTLQQNTELPRSGKDIRRIRVGENEKASDVSRAPLSIALPVKTDENNMEPVNSVR